MRNTIATLFYQLTRPAAPLAALAVLMMAATRAEAHIDVVHEHIHVPVKSGSDVPAGEVIISEIMYNPDGTDMDATAGFNKEWVELYNRGSSIINLGGWQVGDSQDNDYASPFPSGTLIYPGQALVVTGDAATFDAHWGQGINRIQVGNFPILANTPSPTNETIALRDGFGALRDTVNYDMANGWPRINGSQGASVFALPSGLSDAGNDIGTNWAPSSWGAYGAVFSSHSGEENHASPGYVATETQAPFTPSPDAAWSMVLMPDTQNYVKATSEKNNLTINTEWIRDNRGQFKIQAVLHEGDIVNKNNNPNPSSELPSSQQWQNAQNSMFVLNGQVPYIMAAGNHDFGINNAENRDTQINSYFKATDNPLVDPAQGGIMKGEMTAGEIQNAYYAFTAPDGRKMLIFSLEWEPRPAVVAWANQIAGLSEFADYTAVLLTHNYLQSNSTRSTATNVAGDASGQTLWDNLVRTHSNFEMVVNGHFGGDGQGYLASTALPGNVVNQLFFNTQFETQGGNGWIQLVEFLNDGTTVRVRTYSPYLNQMRTDASHAFEFTLSPLPLVAGDYNHDGLVDSADYILWRKSVGSTSNLAADGNGDGVVDEADYLYWRQHFGSGAVSAVLFASAPEPPTILLLIVAGFVWLTYDRLLWCGENRQPNS